MSSARYSITYECGVWCQVWVVIGCGAASSVGCQGSTLAVEKEWVKAMCQGDSALLGRKNAGACCVPCNLSPHMSCFQSYNDMIAARHLNRFSAKQIADFDIITLLGSL